jgi:hypothetical protein
LCAVQTIHLDQFLPLEGGDFYCDINSSLIYNYTHTLTGGKSNLKGVSLTARQLALYGLAGFQCRKGLLPGAGLLPTDRD